jgi:hypothetical protein
MEDIQKIWKCIKRKVEEVSLVLGDEVKINKITHMESASLVGCFYNETMTGYAMKIWNQEHFFPIIGYNPKFLTLAKGWFA